ncbi:hypothetical protein [Vibrio spartinae]|uniref:Uncharacterized protein n=1 Tax=Vibrio spartinae TaxID=1918945 RepID=A0A1N6M9H3_9VIBR|nr:hypothetical protein [Vibrio spartinae]SIO96112.1 hypothetical protein VSP9026_03872 [Vibrio spartinae]
MSTLYQILINHFGTEAKISQAFGVTRAQHFKNRVPEHVALLCHLDPRIPYTYNPDDFGRNSAALTLDLAKPQQATKRAG